MKVNHNRNIINNSLIAKYVQDVPIEGVDFCSEEHEGKRKFMCARNILPERFLSEVTYNNQTYIYILQDARLLGIQYEIGPYWPQLVREFVSNLSEEIADPTNSMFLKVKLRELTGNALTAWTIKGQLEASNLSLKYDVLHKAFISNIIPTSNNTNVNEALGRMLYVMESNQLLNMGKVIFDQIVDHSITSAKLNPIGFPSLICSMLITHHPTILKNEDGFGEDPKSLTISD
ncbi:hypothetical protein LIER_03234 [Lithospermum erythrorhizon]|uniref:Putative plant transposon protein domain-containing protein n=1 Tax=Lithospermum erythrorhizon TaxID=34254 RepID=A0AAV3NX64_LITER